MVAAHEVRFLEHVERCADIASARFERPEGYGFVPGQYLVLTLDTDEGAQSKPFTHSSAISDPYLEMTTRLSGSAFKNALAALVPGAKVRLRGPAGHLVVPRSERRVAFLAGGVGITPAISMLRSWDPSEAPEAVLFYGNREAGCVPFARELETLGLERLRVVHVLEEADASWAGETGFITPGIVARHIDPHDGWLFVVAGPPVMVAAMERSLEVLGVPAERALIERFGPAGAA